MKCYTKAQTGTDRVRDGAGARSGTWLGLRSQTSFVAYGPSQQVSFKCSVGDGGQVTYPPISLCCVGTRPKNRLLGRVIAAD